MTRIQFVLIFYKCDTFGKPCKQRFHSMRESWICAQKAVSSKMNKGKVELMGVTDKGRLCHTSPTEGNLSGRESAGTWTAKPRRLPVSGPGAENGYGTQSRRNKIRSSFSRVLLPRETLSHLRTRCHPTGWERSPAEPNETAPSHATASPEMCLQFVGSAFLLFSVLIVNTQRCTVLLARGC